MKIAQAAATINNSTINPIPPAISSEIESMCSSAATGSKKSAIGESMQMRVASAMRLDVISFTRRNSFASAIVTRRTGTLSLYS